MYKLMLLNIYYIVNKESSDKLKKLIQNNSLILYKYKKYYLEIYVIISCKFINFFIKKGKECMMFSSKMFIFSFIYIIFILAFAGLCIYTLILLIKALKIYIKNNS